ncbi:MAG: sulfatase-like hydrolase/transferase [Verrucomicrobiales bacterium]|nr:sulfatase-like hydrolase/transferase [Verrucomicrobiales bacterium]
MIRQLTFLTLVLCLLPSGFCLASPNIIFIVADDMGYADISSFGAPDLKTPNIDALAAEGVRFTNIYAMGPECTPSRTSFLTGRYPQRVGGMECAIGTGNVGRYDDAIRLAEKNDLGLPADYAVLAPTLKKAGYHNGVFGKWHLGYEDKFSPLDQGFDEFTGFLGGNVEYFRHTELSELEVYLKGRKPVKREGYLTDLITEDALTFLDQRAGIPDVPFFLYLPHAAPHFPFQGPDDDLGRLPTEEEWMEGKRENYIEMMKRLDWSVGEIVKALEIHGMTENTIVVFTSDHGAMKPGLNDPWRDFKGTLFDGGIRVPLIARWPGKLAGGKTSEQVGTLMDVTSSFLHAAAPDKVGDLELDGIDLFGHVIAGEPDQPRTLHWRAKRGDRTWWAIREGNLKYLRKKEAGQSEEWLFDLSSDPGEQENLFGPSHTAELNELRRHLHEWEAEVAPTRGQP